MSTPSTKEKEIVRDWYIVDLSDQVLGRASARIASVLRGKHKPTYSPCADAGDFVIVINADKVKLTGNKLADKVYYHHSGYVGGIKSITAGKLLAKQPEDLITKAVRGMLPKTPLGRRMLGKLKVYSGAEHPHQAQQPKELTL